MGETQEPPPPPTKEEIVTEEIRASILKSLNKPDLEIIDFNAKPGTAAGDNYMSLLYSVKVHMKSKVTGETETVSVMLKTLPKGEFFLNILRENNIFLREIEFYSKVASAIEKFQRNAGLEEKEIIRYWPNCFGCKTDGQNDYLAMEDLRPYGFRMADRKVGLDMDHCKLVLEAQARFHAVSYAMFGGDYDSILEQYPWFHETMYKEREPPTDFMDKAYKQVANKLREVGEEQAAATVDKIFPDHYYKPLYKLTGEKIKWAVIGHGDCWTNNFLFRYDEETNKPIEVKFVDFQLTRATSRAIDIHYFLYSSPKLELLNENEEELEDIYYVEFTRFAKLLGVDLDAHELTKQNFKNEIESYRYFGCVNGLMLAMVTSADKEDVPDLSQVSKESLAAAESDDSPPDNFIRGPALIKMKNIAIEHMPKCAPFKC